MVSPKALQAGTDWFNEGRDGGTGPYRVKQWARGQSVLLEKFDGYWRGWQAEQFPLVQLKVVQEASTQAQMIRSGEAGFISLPSVDVVRALARDPAVSVLLGPSWKNMQVVMNTRKAPTDNLLFRRALTHAWDYAAVVDKVFEGGGKLAKGLIPAGMWGHDPNLNMPGFDLALARQLVEKSGVPPEQRKIVISYISTSEEYKNSLLIFKANLEKIGVSVDLRPGPWGKIWDDAKRLETAPHMMPLTWWPSYATPSDWLIGLFRSEDPPVFNLAYHANPAYDALVNKGVALEAVDRKAAAAQYSLAQQLLIDNAVAIFAADFRGRVIHRKRIKGVSLNPAYEAVDFYALTR
jgi:peptide/nickel transport system substrate-binding protein